MDYGKIDRMHAFATLTADSWLKALPPKAAEILIHLLYLAPVLFAAWLFFKGRRRAATYFLLLGFAYAYVLLSSIFGDGYVELERHAEVSLMTPQGRMELLIESVEYPAPV